MKHLFTTIFRALSDYVGDENSQFDCPGHQGGQFFYKHPTGRAFYNFFGENIFRADLCNADVKLGDLLIHEGYAYDAQAHAAKVYNADKTYFVLNGTSSANKVVLNALLTPGDIILYDRNNHKSICMVASLCLVLRLYILKQHAILLAPLVVFWIIALMKVIYVN